MNEIIDKIRININFHMDEIIYGLRSDFLHHNGFYKILYFLEFEDLYDEMNVLIDDETID